MTHSARLRRLESRIAHAKVAPDVEARCAALNVVELPWLLADFATDKTERRFLHTHALVAFRHTPGSGIVPVAIPSGIEQEPLAPRILVELDVLNRAWADLGSFDDALRWWTNEAEAGEWPRIWFSSAGDYKQFRTRMQEQRQGSTRVRMEPDAGAAQWRRRHPEWSASLSPQDYDAWELSMLGWHDAVDLTDWRLLAKIRERAA